ncbi:hypothetical protein [Comamonas sp.]|uniref:hypothetical protein n=1 Tax=Comamonas sp. TaxID=34028 RepID=UPI002FCC1811
MGGGKDAAQYLKRLFATLILQPVVQYSVNSVMGALGMGQQGSAVQSVLAGGNVGSKVLNNAGAIGAGYQALYGASVGASSASLLGANAVGLMGGDAIGTLAAANGMWAGVATSASQAAVAANLAMEAGTAVALEAGTLSAAASGAAASAGSLMSGFMSAAPWIAGAVALLSVIKGFDDSGTPHSGAGAVYSKATGVQSGAGIYNQATFGMGHRDEYSEAMQAGISGIAQGLGQTLDAFAVSFGKTAGYSVATAFADDSSKDGSWGSLKIADALGNVLVNWEDSRSSKWAPKTFADGEEGFKQYQNEIFQSVKGEIEKMDMAGWGRQILKTATDIDTLNTALQQIATVKTVFEGLGKTMGVFADLSGDLQTRLLAASGGVDALAGNAEAFYQGFFTEGERALKQRELQMAALAGMGLYIDPAEGDAAKDLFRKTVQEAMGSGQVELAAQLLAMSGAFKDTADYGQTLLDATATAAKDAAEVAKDAANEAAATAASWTGLAQVLAMFSGITTDMQAGLLAAAGSMEALTSGAQDFSQGFYSGDERALRQRETQMAALAGMGLYIDPAEGDKAKALFRKTVEEAMASGQTALAVKLQAMSGAFAEAADYAQQFLDNMTEAARQAAEAAAQTAVQSMSGAWSNFGAMAGLAAQYTGNTSGLSAQLGVVQGSYANATTTDGRVAALQQIIGLEQSLWQIQEKERQKAATAQQAAAQVHVDQIKAAAQIEADSARKRIDAAREQLNSANDLLRAAQSLGDYAGKLGYSEASGLSEADRFAVLQSTYAGLLGKARGGDVDALDELQGVSSEMLQLKSLLSVSGVENSVFAGRVAAELASASAVQQASATSQIASLDRQIAAAEAAVTLAQETASAAVASASYAEQQFSVSQDTQKLIDALLAESADSFAKEAAQAQKLVDSGQMTVDALQSLPKELAGAIGASLIPAIRDIASVMAAAAGLDGSHAGGLSYVPFDGYRAELHMGERVLTAAENRSFRMPIQAAPVQQSNKDLEKKVERLEAQMGRMADATEKLLDITDRVSADGNANATELMNIKELAKAIAEATAPAIAKAIAEATA